jgi:hypothetical protein
MTGVTVKPVVFDPTSSLAVIVKVQLLVDVE